jgi:ribonuclease Z
VYTIPLNHRVYTNGFLFKEKEGLRKLNLHAVEEANINVAYYRKLTQGFDVENEDGITIKNETVTKPGTKPMSYAFCSDTMYKEDIISIIKNTDVLYHESTFLEQHAHLASKTKDSTAKEAARIAKQAHVKTLILGHYSTRYDSIEKFKEEAKGVFSNVELAEDGKTFDF